MDFWLVVLLTDPDIPKDAAGAKWYEVPGIWWNTVERLSWTMVGKPAAYGCQVYSSKRNKYFV